MLSIRIPKFRAEHYFGVFLALFWGQDILLNYIRAVFLREPYTRYVANYVFPALMGFCLFLALPYIIKACSWKDLFVVMAVTIVYLFHILLYPDNSEYLLSIAGTFFTAVLPLCFIGLRFDAAKHLRILYVMSVVNIWAFVAYNMFSGATATSQTLNTDFMHRAYVLLPQLLVLMGCMLKKPNIWNVTTAIVGCVFLLMCGNRGAVLLLMLFLVAYIVFLLPQKRHIGVYAGIVAVCAFIAYYFDWLIGALRQLILQLGLSTRVLDRLIAGNFFESRGRDVITQTLLDAIAERPILGHGLAADHVLTGSYAHNYAVELWTAFGLIAGTILLIATLYVIVKGWISTKDPETRIFLLVLVCIGFLKLFLSSSFLYEGMFFMLLGVSVAQIRKNKGVGAHGKKDRVYEGL